MSKNKTIHATVLAGAFVAMCLPVSATVDFQLTDEPDIHNARTCRAWAASQDDSGTLLLWGKTKDNGSSHDLAVLRLTLSCLGDEPSPIVYFGSSTGFNSRFCKDPKFAKEKICASTVAYCQKHKEDC